MALSAKRPGTTDRKPVDDKTLDAWVEGAATAALPTQVEPQLSQTPPPQVARTRRRVGEPSVQLGTKVALSVAERIADIADATGETKRAVIERAINGLPDIVA